MTLGTDMKSNQPVSRRKFIASTSVLLAASQLGVAESAGLGPDKLASEGGVKAVPGPMPKPVRWGEPELQQLGSRYSAAGGRVRPERTSVITYILVYERERGLIGG